MVVAQTTRKMVGRVAHPVQFSPVKGHVDVVVVRIPLRIRPHRHVRKVGDDGFEKLRDFSLGGIGIDAGRKEWPGPKTRANALKLSPEEHRHTGKNVNVFDRDHRPDAPTVLGLPLDQVGLVGNIRQAQVGFSQSIAEVTAQNGGKVGVSFDVAFEGPRDPRNVTSSWVGPTPPDVKT